MLVTTFSLLSLLSAASATHWTSAHRRATVNPDPVAPGDPENGWPELPDTPGSTIVQQGVEKDKYTMPLYLSADKDNSAITRAVMVLPARHRDCWNYWNIVNNALMAADEAYEDVDASTVSIMAPCFLTEVDKNAGSATDQNLIFGTTTWISGHESVGPEGADVSSYKVLDDLVKFYMDKKTFPNLQALTLAGHSAGAQLVQRYAALRKSTKNDDRLHFYLANPGSLLWLTEDRPFANATCTDFDDFKYGLTDKFPSYATGQAKRLGRDGIVEKYNSRMLHYAWGLDDNGNGDTRCQAFTQGSSHLERGQKFVNMLDTMTTGFPNASTVDWVPGISHDATGMMMSAQGQDKLFRTNSSSYAGAPAGSDGDDDGALTQSVSLLTITFAAASLLFTAL